MFLSSESQYFFLRLKYAIILSETIQNRNWKRRVTSLTKSDEVTKELQINNGDIAVALFGNHDKNLTLLEESLNVTINSRGEKIDVSGQEKT